MWNISVVKRDSLNCLGVFRYMLLLKKKKYAAVTMEKKANGDLACTTELKGKGDQQSVFTN